MRVEQFDYALPRSLIAQYPSPQRGDSRLMILRREDGSIEHRQFKDLADGLRPGDLLVINNTRVVPVRVIGNKETGGRCEVLLIPPRNGSNGLWGGLIKHSRGIKKGTRICFGEDLSGDVEEITRGKVKIRFSGKGDLWSELERVGHVPLPPYIKRRDEPLDRERYQTIFATQDGSIAAPTAGLHFTESHVQALKAKGLGVASITLHVGVGTFMPVRVREIDEHQMEEEWIRVPEEAVADVEQTREQGGRVIAVGTTTTRALESFSDSRGRLRAGSDASSLFIRPPYRFRVIDGLITNFHLPKSTLLMLVCAFAGRDLIMRAYEEAVRERYRFYSYGDAMLIV